MEQQLYFISGIAGAMLLLLASIMGYYIFKFKRNFKEEQTSRIQYSEQLQRELVITRKELGQQKNTTDHLEENLKAEQASWIQYSEQLQHELNRTRMELDVEKNTISRLEENLQAEQQSRILYSEQLQHELKTTQAELNEQENTINRLEESLTAEQQSRTQYEEKAEQLERELNTTQTGLNEQENIINRLEESLTAEQQSRILYSEQLQHELNTVQTNFAQLQHELKTTQAKLEEQKNIINRLEESLTAEQQSRILYEENSQQLQNELATIHQTELDEQKNIISRLEENLKAEQQSRILYEKKVEQLQHELATIQAELNEQKKEVNRLQEKIKEKPDDRASREQPDIQETEEDSTDSDELQSQENTGDGTDAPSNSKKDSAEADTTGKQSKTDREGKTQGPRDIKGRRGDPPNAPEGSANHQTEYNPKPELVCQKNGWHWEILLVAPEEQPLVKVQQNGLSLPSPNGEYRLNHFSEDLTIIYEDSKDEERVELYKDESPLIFKLRERWTGKGQKVRGISRGYFIIFAPNEWERKGDPPVAQEACSDERFWAHYFYSDDSSATNGFEEHELSSNQEDFRLQGRSIYDDSDQGLLFIGNPPDLEPTESVLWARIGEEGGEGWKGENFRPSERNMREVLNDRQGWFYVRVYHEAAQLMDSDHFRYSQTLKEIRVDGTIYSAEMLLVPLTSGYREIIIQFIDAEGKNLCPKKKGNNSHTSIRDDGAVIVASHPDGDLTKWELPSGKYSVDTVINLPRVWWRIIETEEFLEAWCDKPIDMSRQKFRENTDAAVQISCPSNLDTIQVGFDSDFDRSYSATLGDENENKHIFELPIRDFVDYEEIDTRLLEDTYLQVQFNGEVIPIIRVPAEEPLLQEIRVNGTIYSEGMLLVPSIDENGKTTGYEETIIEFIDTGGRNIRPKKKGNNSHASIRNDGAIIVEPTPDGELTEWEVGSVDKVLSLPSVWWRITETEEWRATSVDMSHAEFRENTNLVVQISLPSSIRVIQAGFGYNLQRSYTGSMDSANENKRIFELSIRDFVNFEEINTRLSEDTHLQIQCNREVIPIIRVPAERCSECGSTQITEKRYPTEQRIELFCRTCESKWQIENTIVSIAEPQSAKQQTTGE